MSVSSRFCELQSWREGTPSDLPRRGHQGCFDCTCTGYGLADLSGNRAWRGVRQNVSFREVLNLWGDQPKRLPPWFTQRFECRYQDTKLFDTKLRAGFGLQPLPGARPEVLVSVPEQATLELLSDVGKTQSLEEARQIIEALHSLREKILDELMIHVTRIKVVRLAEMRARELDLPWAGLGKRHSQRLGGGKRWVAVGKTGARLELKRP